MREMFLQDFNYPLLAGVYHRFLIWQFDGYLI
nr:MAG TPA: hypothetical protein [Caudoviricetes sp.]